MSQVINIKKCASNFIRFVPKTKKRVFHIPDNYEVVFENSAQSCTAIATEHLGLSFRLLVILKNYRQDYRYQTLKENYRKIIVIEKFDLWPTPTCRRAIYFQLDRNCFTLFLLPNSSADLSTADSPQYDRA